MMTSIGKMLWKDGIMLLIRGKMLLSFYFYIQSPSGKMKIYGINDDFHRKNVVERWNNASYHRKDASFFLLLYTVS
jgi:hypothetical protein